MIRKIVFLLVVTFHLAGTASVASAKVLSAMKQSYQCAKQSAISTVELTGEIGKKAALAAEVAANASACTAVQGGNPAYYIASTGAISAVKAVSPKSVPTGMCASSVKGVVARPFIEGVSYLVPPGSVKDTITSSLKSDLVKDQLWKAIDNVPAAKPFTMQVDCACTTIDNGIAMTDLKAIGESIGRASNTCAAALDSLGLGFVNDIDNKVAEGFQQAYSGLSGGYDELVNGESDPKAPELVYHDYFGKFFDGAVRHGSSRQHGKWLSVQNPQYASNMADAWECRKYYDQHKHSMSSATKICGEMENRFVSMVQAKAASNIEKATLLESISGDTDKYLSAMLAWRIPLPPSSYSQGSFKSKLGSIQCSDEDANFSRFWNCKTTGLYEAALQARAAGADKSSSLKVAFAASGENLGAQLVSYWDANRTPIRNHFYSKWYGPAWEATYPCGLAGQPFGDLCVKQMDLYYDFDCHIPMTVAAAEGTSFVRMEKAISACRTGLDSLRKDAATIATRAAITTFSADMKALCQPHGGSRTNGAACEAIVRDAATDCEKEAMTKLVGGKWKETLSTCWTGKKGALGRNLGQMIVVRTGEVTTSLPTQPTSPITAPKSVPLPNRGN